MPPRDRLGWSLVRRPLQQVDIEGLRGGALDPGGHAVGIRGVERIPAATRPDPDPASGGGLARFVVDELEAPGTGHAVAVKGKGGSGWGGREDVADEYRPRAADHHVAVRPDTTQRRRRQAVENDVGRALDDGVAASPGTGQVVGSHVRSLHQ